MNTEQFNKILADRQSKIAAVLSHKAREYADTGNDDRLYNFRRAAELQRTTPEKALLGMLAKHWVSVLDLIEERIPPTKATIDEKVGDAINYLILLEALLREREAIPVNGEAA